MQDATAFVCMMFFFLILIVVMVALIIRSALKLRLAGVIRRTETSSIVDVKPGFVEVKGRIEPIFGNIVSTPITGTTALLYKTEVQRYEKHGKSGRWKTIWSMRNSVPFLVNDGSAKMKIDPNGAKLEIGLKVQNGMGAFKDADPEFREFLRSQGIAEKGPLGILNHSLRYEESYLEPYRDIYVLGSATDIGLDPDLERDTEIMPYTIRIGTSDKVFLISDRTEGELLRRLMVVNILIISVCSLISLGLIALNLALFISLFI
jgi:hypothetical protein